MTHQSVSPRSKALVRRLARRVGLELELLAPPGLERADVARALARRLGGHVEYGFKYYSEESLPNGRPLCLLADAARVVVDGVTQVTIVDDNTIHAELPVDDEKGPLSSTDDLRLALLAERVCWHRSEAWEQRLGPLASMFETAPQRRGVVDRFGHPIIVPLAEPRVRRRVCELVTRPLRLSERSRFVAAVLSVVNELGLSIPRAGALHAHYDAEPWQSVGPLRRLVLESTSRRSDWAKRLKPNANCVRLGPFEPSVVRVARSRAKVDFNVFAAGLSLAGAKKGCDFNILGVIEPHPKQPTLEVRCLPMSLEADAILGSLGEAEALLASVYGGEDE